MHSLIGGSVKIRNLLIPLVALAGVLGAGSYAAAADAPVTRTISVGDDGDGVAVFDFLPHQVTIHQGDTLHFANPSLEGHTTTYVPAGMDVPGSRIPNASGAGLTINPRFYEPTNAPGKATDVDPLQYYNSGVMSKGDSVDVVFSAVGNFKFICLFHPGMELAVDVTSTAGTTASQADLDKQGDAQRDALIASGKAIIAAAQQTKVTDASGVSTWDLQAGADPGQTEVMRFLPDRPLRISTGDTVKWTTKVFAPHTVTFGDSPEAAPAGESIYNGGNANSGVMYAPNGRDTAGRDLPPAPAGSTYTLTFPRAGTYTYVCLIHANQGMTGTIVVTDKAPAQPSPPSDDSADHRIAYALGATAVAALAIVAAGTWVVRRRRIS
jgi:plastocyanin